MRLGQCTFGTAPGEGIRCGRAAERLREIPGREPLTVHAVCLPHAEVIDRYLTLCPERIRSEDLLYEAAHLIKETERLIGQSQDLRSDRWDKQASCDG